MNQIAPLACSSRYPELRVQTNISPGVAWRYVTATESPAKRIRDSCVKAIGHNVAFMLHILVSRCSTGLHDMGRLLSTTTESDHNVTVHHAEPPDSPHT